MALTNYTELLAFVARQLWDRDDLSAEIPVWVLAAEADFNSQLRLREMETSASITLTNGSGSLPSDYLAWRRVLTQDSPVRELEWAEPNWAEDYYYANTAAGLANFFTIIGANIKTYQTSSSNLTMHYYQKIPALVTNTTNWLLTRSPLLYVYQTCVHASPMLDDDERTQMWATLATSMKEDLKKQDMMGRYGKSVMRIKGSTP